MIGKLRGKVDDVEKDHVILDVQGVGYIVYGSSRTLQSLPSQGEAAMLFIETHVREDHIHLYGFVRTAERDCFRELTTVKGVGAKVALAILSVANPADIAAAVAAKDKAVFTRANGVGPKLAERILVELKDRLAQMGAGGGVAEFGAIAAGGSGTDEAHEITADAVSALTNLGYARTEAYQVVTRLVKKQEVTAVGDLIRLSLKELAR